jgi:hypothetical protein
MPECNEQHFVSWSGSKAPSRSWCWCLLPVLCGLCCAPRAQVCPACHQAKALLLPVHGRMGMGCNLQSAARAAAMVLQRLGIRSVGGTMSSEHAEVPRGVGPNWCLDCASSCFNLASLAGSRHRRSIGAPFTKFDGVGSRPGGWSWSSQEIRIRPPRGR